jgi:hypothetical protein
VEGGGSGLVSVLTKYRMMGHFIIFISLYINHMSIV